MKKPHLVRIFVIGGSLVLHLTAPFRSLGDPGDVDLSFNPGTGINNTVRTVALQGDGKMLISGEFTTVSGLTRKSMARLNADGSGDMSFDLGTGNPFYSIEAILPQSDGKAFIGHYFGAARLNSNGTIDPTFSPSFDSLYDEYWGYAQVHAVTVQPDGKLITGGEFYVWNGANVNIALARFNTNGSLDTNFNVPQFDNAYPYVYAMALQPDGKLLVGGTFTDGTNYHLTRLNPNGSRDTNFNTGAGPDSTVRSIVLQPDGKVLIGGDFTTFDGTNRAGLARLNDNGTLDAGFVANLGTNLPIRSIALQSNGKLLVGAHFSTRRLNGDGSLDGTFNVADCNADVKAVILQPDNKVIACGAFSLVNGTNQFRLVRLNSEGGFDGTFNSGNGGGIPVNSIVLTPGGKVLVGGLYTFVNGTNQYATSRLNSDGSLDTTFRSDTNFSPDFSAILTNSDCPAFYNCDTYFESFCLAVQTDGKVLMGGQRVTLACDPFENICDNIYRPYLLRFNADGSRDTNFPAGISSSARAILLQPDGKIVFADNAVYRLNADGTADGSFSQGALFAGYSPSLQLQADGRILVSTGYGLARLNSDGTRDPCFNPNFTGYYVYCIALQEDGRILVGGSFSAVNGVNRKGLARLNANGSLDTSFDPGTGADGPVRAIRVQSDGNILICGEFLTIDEILRPFVARLFGGTSAVLPNGPELRMFSTNNNVVAAWPSASTGFTLQKKTNLEFSTWLSVTNSQTIVGSESLVTLSNVAGQGFFRLSSPVNNPPAPPAVAPAVSATTTENSTVSLTWNAFPGATGHHVQRSTNVFGPYTTIANPSTTNYIDGAVVSGKTYYYSVSVIYPCGESATGSAVATPYVTASVHVQSITMSFVAQGSRYDTRAVVRVVDNYGVAISGATVTGNFTGSISNNGRSGTTSGSGDATITSSSSIKNGTVTFTVTVISAGSLGYNSGANIVSSSTVSR